MLLNKHEEIDEEQGFIKAKQQISIDYKSMFSSVPQKFRCNPFSKKIKLHKIKIESIDNIKYSPFINQTVRQQHVHAIVKNHRPNVIFNNFNNQIGHSEPNLTFDASFPMSNLEVVTRVKNCHYQAYMRPDTNTNTHFQWFYFRVHIIKKKKIKFTIKNFIKATMLYSKGLKPFYLSKKQENGGKYMQINQQVVFSEDTQSDFFNLTFTFDFKHDNDEIYFASQPPYGYQDLQKTLAKIKHAKRYVLGKTVLGTKIPYLVFNQKLQSKVIGIAIARQHPGQVVGSWMMDGFINQINKHKFSNQIQWIVIPMINIDGVQLGNNRTGVLGHDFNRNWNVDQFSKKQKMFPELSAVLNYLRKLKRKHPKKVRMFLDLHGHSSQQNVFTYGPQHTQKSDFYYLSRVFPQILANRNHNFKLSQSSYKINNDKKNAARSIILNQFKIPFTYTIQCTFGVMNQKRIAADQVVKVGEDIAIAANQFLERLYAKQPSSSSNFNLIQEMRQKYTGNKLQGEEYDSASQSSQDNPGRKQFQMNIQDLLFEKPSKRSSVTKLLKTQVANPRAQLERCKRKNSQEGLNLKNNQILGQETLKSLNYAKTSKKKSNRVATQGCNPEIYNQCAYFPPVKSRYNFGKTPIPDKFHSVSKVQQQAPGMMNLKEIQQRLFKLRNSRIGKKILIINAYGV